MSLINNVLDNESLDENSRPLQQDVRKFFYDKRTLMKLSSLSEIFGSMNYLRQFEDRDGFEYVEDEIDLDVKAVFALYKGEIVK